jgi:hypothetical protein
LGVIFLGISVAIAMYVATTYAPGVRGTPIETPEQYISLFGHAVSRLDFLFFYGSDGIRHENNHFGW